ncbi:MAG: alpha/beta fold hydrolase [Flavobacteriaceae bacterium]
MNKPIFSLFFIFFLSINLTAQDSLAIKPVDSIIKPVPTDILFKRSKLHDFSISPDGKYFAEIEDNNIERDIIIVDIDGYKVYNRIPMGKNSIQNIYWLSEKRLIYESLGEILAIDIDGSNATVIVSRLSDMKGKSIYSFYRSIKFNNVISLLPNNKNEILIETFDYEGNADIKRVNIYTGEKITVLSGKHNKINKWITDAKGNVKFGMRFDEEGYAYYKLNEKNDKWEIFNVNIENQVYELRVDGTSYLNKTIDFLGYGFEDDIIYLTTNINSDKKYLVSYDLKSNTVKDVLLKDVNCDVIDSDGKDVSLIFDFNNFELAGIKYDGILPQYKWFSEDYKNKHSKLNDLYPQFINEIIDSDYSNTRLLIYQWNDVNAGNIGVYDSSVNSYAVMFHFNDELNKYQLSKTKNVIATTRDDFKIPCYLNLPEDYSKDNKVPLVVIPHGGPWARDYWEFDDFSQYFSSRGYAALRVNFRGSTGFGKNHVLAGVNSIDEVMINDIADAVGFVSDNFYIDKNRVFIFGHSYGGYATYMSLIKYPNLYSAGVAISAPSDLKEWMRQQKKEKNYFAYEFWNTALGSNQSKYLNKISPINYAEDFNIPLLIFHGKKDDIIPVEHSQEMIEALNEYKKDAKLEVLQNEGHSIYDSNSLGYIMDSANEFFKKQNKKD